MNRPLTKEELSIFTTILVGILFLLMGIGIGSDGIPTKTIKIVPTETQINVYTHTKSTWPPFKSIDYSVKNVKHAVLTGKGSLSSFRSLELETYNGKYFHITAGSHFPSFRQNLKNRINDAIESRTPSTIVFRETPSLIEGIAFTIVGILTILFGLFWHIKIKREEKTKITKINEEQKQLLNVLKKRMQQQQEDPYIPQQTQKPKSEKDNYKKINDSIIK